MPIAKTPASNQDFTEASSNLTPPVITILINGNGANTFFTYSGPTVPAGNNFTRAAPDLAALYNSVGEKHPGIQGIFLFLQAFATSLS